MGNHHFYANVEYFKEMVKAGVNALQRATIISTVGIALTGLALSGVNALQRATIISTVNVDGTPEAAVVCQCPSTGNHHFYAIDFTMKHIKLKGVNALQRATIISTRPMK